MSIHPYLFFTTDPDNELRTVADLRKDIKQGWMHDAWSRILFAATEAVKKGPVLPDRFVFGRDQAAMKQRNPDFYVCEAAGHQLLRAALAHMLTGRMEFKESAMQQLAALYDPAIWPDWIDQAHVNQGFKADLRTGALAQDVGLAYDWLAASLSPDERAWVIEGLDRRAIRPYLESMEKDAWWNHDQNNWLTVIVGGLGIAGMALDGEHPMARRLIDIALEKMEAYLSIYGPQGEFNESVNYASANRYPVNFFLAHHYWSGGEENRLEQAPFPAMCQWIMHTTVPPGRVLTFGDCLPAREVVSGYIAAVAAASYDGVAQWFFEQYQSESIDPYPFVTYDSRVEARSPEGWVPNFKTYAAHGKLVISRTDWSPQSTACVVFAKAGREEHHEHNDVGQLCIDGHGERLIVDLGSPSSFPGDYGGPQRWSYYNASIRGHNVLMFDDAEQRSPERLRVGSVDLIAYNGKVTEQKYVSGVGSAWKMDVSPAYQPGQQVTRTVLHFYPGFVAVLDEANLTHEQEISLRWHTCDIAAPDPSGRFVVHGLGARVDSLITRLDEGEMRVGRGEHHYHAPFDRGRAGGLLELREESYVQAIIQGCRCRILTLFCVQTSDAPAVEWTKVESGWMADDVRLYVNGSFMEFSSRRSGSRISLD
ncbi:MAG: heparinase II/III family protein [Cephaloticoccus sp.]|nr:heparinase II/III family protein [Cephaloticoccus sp.]MCF7760287.1 heparinase II/III family protein [Cephaloticoccus sp.]